MPKVPPRPEGMPWISPYLAVKDTDRAIEFYTKAFGFVKRFAVPGPNGKTQHAELLHKDSVIMLGPENPQAGDKSAKALGGSPVTLYIYVEDVDALVKRARQAGAQVALEPKDEFWGDRISLLIDPEGHRWCFATHVRDVDPSELHPPKQ